MYFLTYVNETVEGVTNVNKDARTWRMVWVKELFYRNIEVLDRSLFTYLFFSLIMYKRLINYLLNQNLN